MSTYGISHYGRPTLYGPGRAATVVPGGPSIPLVNNAYLVDPFTATPIDYFSVLLTWNGPDPTTDTPMNEFRLLSSRYGFPVDENDGNILIDTTSAPGTQFVDQTVVPGQISYYGFYILGENQWIRSGFTACLMPVNHGYADRLWSYLPEYLRDVQNNELTASAAGDTYLSQFLAVAGWSMDYLKTQYDFLYANQNNPMKMSFTDLADLSHQIGMPFPGELPAYYLRKAAENWALVMRQRGSLAGISEHMNLLSGYSADVQLSRNIMLENDQSLPYHPAQITWSAGLPYKVGEIVSWPAYPEWVPSQAYVVNNYVVYNGVNYQCTATGGQGVPPTGAVTSGTYWAVAAGPFFYECTAAITSFPGTAPPAAPASGSAPTGSNSNWQLVYDQDNTTGHLAITGLSGGLNTWEVLGATAGSTTPKTTAVAANSLVEGNGAHNPLNFSNDYSQNTIRVYNKSGGTEDTWLRSLSRMAADITAGSAVPDPQTVIEHAIPVPQTNATLNEWNSETRYGTGDVVLYNDRNYLALRASTGATPPSLHTPLNQNYDFESGVSPWTIQNNATIAQSGAEFYHGSNSLRVTPDGVTANPGAKSENITVIPLATYIGSAFVYLATAWSGGVQLAINWFDAFGATISTVIGPKITPAATTWAKATVSAQAPANAATARFIVRLSGTPANTNLAYFDLAKFECAATPEWQPLGIDSRIPLMISAQTSQNLSVATAEQFAITPFVEWYDNWGTLITRAFARTLSNYTYDSFSSPTMLPLIGRTTDTADQNWAVPTGSWTMINGTVYPAITGTRSVALVTGSANAQLGVTLGNAGASTGAGTPSPVTYIGAYGGPTEADYVTAYGTIGPLKFTKFFSAGTIADGTDSMGGGNGVWQGTAAEAVCNAYPGTAVILCWNTLMTQAEMNTFTASIPAGQVVGFSFAQEPEGDPTYAGTTGAAQFVTNWEDQVTKIRAAGNANLLAIMEAEAYEYTSAINPAAVAGDYLPSSSYVDIYAVHVYQHQSIPSEWPSQGLANYGRYQTWENLAAAKGKPLAISEYGIDATVSDAERNARLALDIAYIDSAFGSGGSVSTTDLWCFGYWWWDESTTDASKFYQFTDAATIATWENFITPKSHQQQALVFRYSDDNDYWKATTQALIKKVSGTFTTVATYSANAQAGDRLTVQLSGSSITVQVNGVTVATATDSFNSTATEHGIMVE